ncbi:MAG: DUF975 family protein [Lachnospiraceae bacterium]|nr:DUF975 family protein [Lachnospiraceae bacterium]
MIRNKEIKARARTILHGKYSSFITYFLIAYLLQTLIVNIPSTFLASPKNLPLFLSQILLTFLLEALGAMIMIGMNKGALQLIRGQKLVLTDLFFSFRNQPDHFLSLELILTLIKTVASIPGFIFIWVAADMELNFLVLSAISSLFTAFSTVLTFLLTMLISMSEFLMLDDPSMTAGEAMKYSVLLLKGHVLQYFLLIAGFLGLILLGFASATIGFLWIIPYITLSRALFYEKLMDLQDEACQSYI